MAKEKIPFETFLEAVGTENKEFAEAVHQLMLENGYACQIKEQKTGYMLSYVTPEKRTVANYVFRKQGPKLRIYANHVADYMQILDTWPDSMKAVVKKCGPCKKMLDPNDCSPTCRMGYDFILDGQREQKCRFNCFLFFLTEETKPYLEEMLECELRARKAS